MDCLFCFLRDSIFADVLTKRKEEFIQTFDSKKIGELDFVLQKGLSKVLLEIKAGNDFKKHPAMDHAQEAEQESLIYKIDLTGLGERMS